MVLWGERKIAAALPSGRWKKQKGWLDVMEDERGVSDHLWLLERARRRMDGRAACAVHVSLRHDQGEKSKQER